MFDVRLHQNEKLLKMFRQTELVLIKHGAVVFLLIYFPWFFLIKYDLDKKFRSALFIWTALVLIYGLYKFFLWMLNVYLITNQRLIIVGYHNLFGKTVTETPLSHIANIGYSTKNFFYSLFNSGNINIQVMAMNQQMILKNVKHPEKIKDFIWQNLPSHFSHPMPGNHLNSINP